MADRTYGLTEVGTSTEGADATDCNSVLVLLRQFVTFDWFRSKPRFAATSKKATCTIFR